MPLKNRADGTEKAQAMPGRSCSRRAFSLFELLIVLLILSLCAATTIRWYFSNADITLENAATLLAHDLRAAEHRSIFLGEPGRMVFLPDGSGYTLTDELGILARHPQTDLPFMRIYSEDGVFTGVEIAAARAGEDRTLVIDDRGRATEDLSVTLRFEGHERSVHLDHASGRISIEGSTSDWVDDGN